MGLIRAFPLKLYFDSEHSEWAIIKFMIFRIIDKCATTTIHRPRAKGRGLKLSKTTHKFYFLDDLKI